MRRGAPASVRRVIADVRALGATAPLRAGYEASKRLGGHRLVFGSLARLATPSAVMLTPPPGLSPPAGVPDAAVERAALDAEDVVAGKLTVFGRTLDWPAEPDWHRAPDNDARWPAVPWWTIDLRSSARLGDVKWTWEPARHRHLVVLARAAHCRPQTPAYAEVLEAQLSSWLRQNPPETGVHWYSNLELALRAIAWLQVLALVGDRLSQPVRDGLRAHLWHTGRHLVADLPYTASSMRNNHLLGDALGLMALGEAFGRVGRARRWWRLGNRLFDAQLARHMRPDGSMVEDSLSYHRFVLEMLEIRMLLADVRPEHRDAMLDAAQFLCRLGALDGELPQYGDWDEGRVLASSGDRSDVGGSVRLALSLAGTGAAAGWRSAYDECAWHARAGEPVVADPARVRGQTAGAHFGRAQVGPFTVWLKLGASPSHGHADLGHVSVRRNDLWIVGDPGTGTYNGDPAVRDYFRSGRAHNVLRCADRDLILAHRAFRWASKATGVLGPPIRVGEAVVMWGVHDAYAGHEHGGHVARAVVVDAHSIGVIDWTERPMPAWARSVPLAPSLSATAGGGDVAITGADTPDLRLAVAGGVTAVRRGGIEPYAGWWSRTYGETEPAAVVETTGQDAVVLAWMLYDGSAPTVAVSAPATARIGAFELSMSWQAREAELLVRSGANEESVRVDLPAVAAPARGRR